LGRRTKSSREKGAGSYEGLRKASVLPSIRPKKNPNQIKFRKVWRRIEKFGFFGTRAEGEKRGIRGRGRKKGRREERDGERRKFCKKNWEL
jgi:hypothetical protein